VSTRPNKDLSSFRGHGHTWVEIAAELGGTPQARRMQLARAIRRIAPAIGLDTAGPSRERCGVRRS
jgi:hypothetical protein